LSLLNNQVDKIDSDLNQYYMNVEDFRKSSGLLIDTRSPSEFQQGHIPGAYNIPLFSNEERELVGTTYKKRGRNKAIELGMKLIGPKLLELVKSIRILEKKMSHSNKKKINRVKIYCWRGGMRSASFGWLLNLYSYNIVILEGGYKSYRKWVLSQFDRKWPLILLGGRTGTNKTAIIEKMINIGLTAIDLEGLANHRGSSFGGLGLPKQPTSEHYENKIATQLNNINITNNTLIWVEAESGNLGKCRIPNSFLKQMKNSYIVEIVKNKKERILNLVKLYASYDKILLIEATERIQKRLGPQRTLKAINAINSEQWYVACEQMLDYYDRCYEHELGKSSTLITIDLSGISNDEAITQLQGINVVI
tara:strand:+ start:727 stop:1818 length:1092 start_codon:yes stop_codon:yes gene_type:complete